MFLSERIRYHSERGVLDPKEKRAILCERSDTVVIGVLEFSRILVDNMHA